MNKQTVMILALVPILGLACMSSIAQVTVTATVPASTSQAVLLDDLAHHGPLVVEGPAREVQSKCYRVIADESLWVRGAGEYQAAVVGYLAHGDIVTADGAGSAGWQKVIAEHGALTGWVNAAYLEEVECG
jgi:hypothetical protein